MRLFKGLVRLRDNICGYFFSHFCYDMNVMSRFDNRKNDKL